MFKTYLLAVAMLATLSAQGQRGKKQNNTTTVTTTTTTTVDTLYNRCGMQPVSTGWVMPTYQLTNIDTSHRTAFLSDPSFGLVTKDALVIAFDAVQVPNKTVKGYMLLAGPCGGRVGCATANGLYVAQVTYQVTNPRFDILMGLSWLGSVIYDGVISIEFTDNCIMYSQPFKFRGPAIY